MLVDSFVIPQTHSQMRARSNVQNKRFKAKLENEPEQMKNRKFVICFGGWNNNQLGRVSIML